MFELAKEIDTAMRTETTPIVQIWMNWMVGLFFASIIFVWHKKSARFILATILMTLVFAAEIFYFTKNVHLFSIPHLVLWAPLAVYLIRAEFRKPDFKITSIYGIYLTLLVATIAVSLVFDIRDMILISMGMK